MKVLFAAAFAFCLFAVFADGESVEWRALDNKKSHLSGIKLTEGDLRRQPILVVKFEPAAKSKNAKGAKGKGAKSDGEQKSESKAIRFPAKLPFEEDSLPPRYIIINVPSRELEGDEIAGIAKSSLLAGAAPGWPVYSPDFGLVNEPENKAKTYPFYYVVTGAGKVAYSGNSVMDAINAVVADVKVLGVPDPLFGYFRPNIHTDVTETMKLGEDTTKSLAKIKSYLADKKDSDDRKEAIAIMQSLDQTKTYWQHAIECYVAIDPLKSWVLAQSMMKTFPRDKAPFAAIIGKLSQNPVVAKSAKTYIQILAYREHMPEKKSEVQKAYQLVCNAEKQCAKARKEFGAKLPPAIVKLEDVVLAMKMELEARGAVKK